MQRSGSEFPYLDDHIYDNGDFDPFGTPNCPRFGSQNALHHVLDKRQRGEDPILESSDQESVPYTITWKLQLRKGRISTLTEDTIEALTAPPSAYWIETLQSELATVVQDKLPEPQYKPDETRITVSTSKHGQPPFDKRFEPFRLEWKVVEEKLRSWGNRGSKLMVAIRFIYKESQPAAVSKTSKTGRGATRKQLAARDKLVAQQEASGARPVWKEVYALFECSSAVCPNRGFSCWRDSNTKKHYKLDSDIMDKLVDLAEEDHPLIRHDDVPETIRDLIYRHEEEATARKTRKRKASDTPPINIRLCCQGRHDDSSAECSDTAKRGRQIKLKFPMRKDEAPKLYTDWLCGQVSNGGWRQGYQLACKVTLEQGYDLEWLYTAQNAGTKMLVANRVKSGIATQYVSRVSEWLDDIATK